MNVYEIIANIATNKEELRDRTILSVSKFTPKFHSYEHLYLLKNSIDQITRTYVRIQVDRSTRRWDSGKERKEQAKSRRRKEQPRRQVAMVTIKGADQTRRDEAPFTVDFVTQKPPRTGK